MISLISQFELAYRKAPLASEQASVHICNFVCYWSKRSSSMIALPPTASMISSLLLLSGDIELNPGPETESGKV